MDLLSAIELIAEKAEGSGMTDDFYRKVAEPLRFVSRKMGLTLEQSAMFALLVDKGGNDTYVSLSDLAEYASCRKTRMLRHSKSIEALKSRELVNCVWHGSTINYNIPLDVIEALKENRRYHPREYSGLGCREMFDVFHDIIEQVDDDRLAPEIARARIMKIVNSNQQREFVRKLKEYNLDETDTILVVLFCHLYVEDGDDNVGFYDIRCMFSKEEMYLIKDDLTEGTGNLHQKHIIEFHNEDGFANRESYNLTMEPKRALLAELHLPSLSRDRARRNIIKSNDIKTRNLYYPASVIKSIDELGMLLDIDHYNDIRTRMQQQGFRCGFNCLFYGAPGTGKTETALQLARRTGRDIMQVNLAELKSMWVGESEKNVKALFDT